MIVENSKNNNLYSKTETDIRNGAWFVGFAEKNDIYYFVIRFDDAAG